MSNGRVYAHPYLALVSWPLGPDVWPLRNVAGAEDGTFVFSGVIPGEYRLIALPDALATQLHDPQFLSGLLPNATAVTVNKASYQRVALKLYTGN